MCRCWAQYTQAVIRLSSCALDHTHTHPKDNPYLFISSTCHVVSLWHGVLICHTPTCHTLPRWSVSVFRESCCEGFVMSRWSGTIHDLCVPYIGRAPSQHIGCAYGAEQRRGLAVHAYDGTEGRRGQTPPQRRSRSAVAINVAAHHQLRVCVRARTKLDQAHGTAGHAQRAERQPTKGQPSCKSCMVARVYRHLPLMVPLTPATHHPFTCARTVVGVGALLDPTRHGASQPCAPQGHRPPSTRERGCRRRPG